MSTEALMLVLSVFLGIGQILLATFFATKANGILWNISSREVKTKVLSGAEARVARAAENFKETFPFFAAIVLIVIATNRTSPSTALAAQVYFFARLLYVPIYAFGINYVRTLVWSVASGAILFMAIQLL